jgi:hypothetical protein
MYVCMGNVHHTKDALTKCKLEVNSDKSAFVFKYET